MQSLLNAGATILSDMLQIAAHWGKISSMEESLDRV